MPVIIQEIQINMEVGDQPSPAKSSRVSAAKQSPDAGKQDLVSQCVEEVLRILKEKEER